MPFRDFLKRTATLATFQERHPLSGAIVLNERGATTWAVHFSLSGSSPRNVCKRILFLSFDVSDFAASARK